MAFMNPFIRFSDFLWKEWFQNCDFFEEKNVFMLNETFIVIFRHYVNANAVMLVLVDAVEKTRRSLAGAKIVVAAA